MTFWVRGTQVSGEQRFNQRTSERVSKYMVRLLVQAWVETLQQLVYYYVNMILNRLMMYVYGAYI